MASYNKVILVGNLTRDPQLRFLPSQTPVCEFGLAVNHKYKTKDGQEREDVLFIDCSCFGRGGEIINQYCQKGKQLLVEGRLKYETWEDKQGGGKRSKHKVEVENFQFLGGAGQGGGGNQGGGDESAGGDEGGGGGYQQRAPQRAPQRPVSRPPQQQRPPAEAPFSEEQQFKDDDIPF